MARSALGRRRGTTRGEGRSAQEKIIVGLVVALVSTALLLGIIVGGNVLSTSNNNNDPEHKLSSVEAIVANEKLLRGAAADIGFQMEHHSDEKKSEYELQEAAESDNDVYKDATDDDGKPGTDDNAYDDDKAGKIQHEPHHEPPEHLLRRAPPQEEEHHEPPKLQENDVSPPTDPFPYLGSIVPADYSFRDWTAPGGKRFEEYKAGGTPYLITDELKKKADEVARSRRVHVKNAMKFAWDGYDKHAFGQDEVNPVRGGGSNGWGGMGTTLVDSLDTLWLMGLKDEFYKARDWVRDELSHDHADRSVSVFETTIRSLGGLLSAYDWSGDEAFSQKAADLGKRLFKAFDSPSGIPYGQVNLATGRLNNLGWAGGNAILAELGTLQIEFRYLAKAMNVTEYATKCNKVFEIMDSVSPANGLFPYYIKNHADTPTFANNKITFGAMADSFYEYMLKIWLQGGKTEPLYRKMYDKAMQGMHDELLQTSTPSGLVYIADKNSGHMDHKMDHLVCFMGGLLALGAYTDPQGLDSERAQRDLKTGKALTYTCYQMYARMNTGISAEWVQFHHDEDFAIGHGSPHYLLRPEAVESMFILNQLTGDPIYREWGWEVFSAIERYCKTKIAYGQIRNVQDVDGPPQDKMESFFLAETLKYLYLLQDPDTPVDILNKHVFNTEAHPMRIFPVIDKEGAVAK